MEQLQVEPKLENSNELVNPTENQPQTRIRSYHPTSWPLVNRVLDIIDAYTGKAGFVQKFVSFAFFGGLGAIVNLVVYAALLSVPMNGVHFAIHDAIAYVIAFEISVFANFIPNDYFTFRHAAGRERSWLMRGLRFNITSISGGLLTYIIHFALMLVLSRVVSQSMASLGSQAIAQIVVMFYNFTFHHLFTYRKVKAATN
jgi:putative flippase GtrA